MKTLEGYLDFWPEFKAEIQINEADLCFLYHKNQLLLKKQDGLMPPSYKECNQWISDTNELWYLGSWKGQACFAYEMKENECKVLDFDGLTVNNEIENTEQEEKIGVEWVGFRDSKWNDAPELYQIAVKAQHLLNWDRTTQYCGCCGHLYERKKDERAKICPNCGHIQFPRISPAIIVGIKKGNEILMAHNSGFREGLYSVIAGFVEQGETLETAVKREVYEEVGIKVKNIKYFQSKPWNSVDSLMLGFVAEYESGEIKVDGKEIVDAKWCDKDHMPKVLPDKISTAWHIINEIIGLEE